ncbi:jg26318 [Pararge aegeria aegeria]|uniref:Jg26318 protein n=1 Tax=Pararge aegeria aegeria TaxID=348720 RepID=A0A8S4RA62_9NEOP|nr:jg26318 [Pararge aegeria aegeria]
MLAAFPLWMAKLIRWPSLAPVDWQPNGKENKTTVPSSQRPLFLTLAAVMVTGGQGVLRISGRDSAANPDKCGDP